jgi:uncharacterized paraquat-inducible protein A
MTPTSTPVHHGRLIVWIRRTEWADRDRAAMTALQFLGKLAMADVFLVAVYIIVVKEAGMARVDPAWGLWLFTFCVLASIGLGHLTARGKRA